MPLYRNVSVPKLISDKIIQFRQLILNTVAVAQKSGIRSESYKTSEARLISSLLELQKDVKLSLLFFCAPIYNAADCSVQGIIKSLIDRNSWVYNANALERLGPDMIDPTKNYVDIILTISDQVDRFFATNEQKPSGNIFWNWLFGNRVVPLGTETLLNTIPIWIDNPPGSPRANVRSKLINDLKSSTIYSPTLLKIVSGEWDGHIPNLHSFLNSEYQTLRRPVVEAILKAKVVPKSVLQALVTPFDIPGSLTEQQELRKKIAERVPVDSQLADQIESDLRQLIQDITTTDQQLGKVGDLVLGGLETVSGETNSIWIRLIIHLAQNPTCFNNTLFKLGEAVRKNSDAVQRTCRDEIRSALDVLSYDGCKGMFRFLVGVLISLPTDRCQPWIDLAGEIVDTVVKKGVGSLEIYDQLNNLFDIWFERTESAIDYATCKLNFSYHKAAELLYHRVVFSGNDALRPILREFEIYDGFHKIPPDSRIQYYRSDRNRIKLPEYMLAFSNSIGKATENNDRDALVSTLKCVKDHLKSDSTVKPEIVDVYIAFLVRSQWLFCVSSDIILDLEADFNCGPPKS